MHRLHAMSTQHREQILRSRVLGCFVCVTRFEVSAVDTWWDPDDHGIGQTATCPYCGLDTVIGDAMGVELTDDLLSALEGYLFWRIES
ncbi:hypothetical protein SAHY_06373 [Salinisphaera hydrothermalis EPR70]